MSRRPQRGVPVQGRGEAPAPKEVMVASITGLEAQTKEQLMATCLAARSIIDAGRATRDELLQKLRAATANEKNAAGAWVKERLELKRKYAELEGLYNTLVNASRLSGYGGSGSEGVRR